LADGLGADPALVAELGAALHVEATLGAGVLADHAAAGTGLLRAAAGVRAAIVVAGAAGAARPAASLRPHVAAALAAGEPTALFEHVARFPDGLADGLGVEAPSRRGAIGQAAGVGEGRQPGAGHLLIGAGQRRAHPVVAVGWGGLAVAAIEQVAELVGDVALAAEAEDIGAARDPEQERCRQRGRSGGAPHGAHT
jgi:hypothetical protein